MAKTQVKGKDVGDKSITDVDIDFSHATEKTVLADGDSIIIHNSVSGNTERSRFTYVKSSMKTYFDTLYNNYSHPASHPYSIISDPPASLPANGGNADTVDSKHAVDFHLSTTGTASSINDPLILPGIYKVEADYNVLNNGLGYQIVQHLGGYQGAGGYAVQICTPYDGGTNHGIWTRVSQAGIFGAWEKMAKISDLPTNVDTVDGYHLDQDVRTSGSPSFRFIKTYWDTTNIDGAHDCFLMAYNGFNPAVSNREFRIQQGYWAGSIESYLMHNGHINGTTVGNRQFIQGVYNRFAAIAYDAEGNISFLTNPGAVGNGSETVITPYNTLFLKYNGYVGIGKIPTTNFDVNGEIRLSNPNENSLYALIQTVYSDTNAFKLSLSGHNLITTKDDYWSGGTLQFWTADAPRITILSDGKTGFGTVSPSYRIDAVGTIRTTDTIDNSIIVQTNGTTHTSQLRIVSGSGTVSARKSYVSYESSETVPQYWRSGLNGYKRFSIYDTTATAERFTILDSSGYIGVHQVAPQCPLDVNGEFRATIAKIGDVAGGHYFEIESDGSVVLHGNATVFMNLRIPLTSTKQNASSKPDFDYTNVGYLFPQNDTSEILYAIVSMPPAWKEGSELFPSINWKQKVFTDVPIFKIDYSWVNIGDAISAPSTTVTISTQISSSIDANKHQVSTSSAAIDGTDKTINSLLLIKIYREDNDVVGDTLTYQLNLHYEIDSLGSH